MKVEGMMQPTLQQKKVKSTLTEYAHRQFDCGMMKEKNTTNVFLAFLTHAKEKHLPYLVPTKAQEPRQGLAFKHVI